MLPSPTRFVLESSKMLKQDPADTSAQALLAIYQTLLTTSGTNSSANPPALTSPEQIDGSSFILPKNAFIVNILWYISLSLSVATAFLAMLAKDWCHSFASRRVGHPYDQARRRQRKWKLIKRWKMKELIMLLPSLMHLSLLLFSVGLCLYLWDLNNDISIVVMCIFGAFLAFYVWSSITASVVEFFPYTTIISRIIRSKQMEVFHPYVAACGRAISGLVLLVYIGVTLLFMAFMFIVTLQACVWALVFFTLDKLSSSIFVKTWDEVLDRSRLFGRTVSNIGLNVWMSLYFPFSWVYSRVGDELKKLELTEELITSLTLSWLIEYCETPRAVDIALQAISGASRRDPKEFEPLFKSQAPEQILRRIVSDNTGDMEKLMNGPYVLGLETLDLQSVTNFATREHRISRDIEVMLWELKSKNELQIAELIMINCKDASFVPSEANLEAMFIGNCATIHCLDILLRGSQNDTQRLNSIHELFSNHFKSQGKLLHSAAVQSLANAAALHTLFSKPEDLPSSLDLVGSCMRYCNHLVRGNLGDKPDRPDRNFGTAVVLIVGALVHKSARADHNMDATQPYPWVPHAIRALIDLHQEDNRKTFQRVIVWIGCTEILSHRSEYSLYAENDDWEPLETWCSQFASYIMRECGDPSIPSWHWAHQAYRNTRSAFLAAVGLVYGLIKVPETPDASPRVLPNVIRTMLTLLACGTPLDPGHNQACHKILSISAFPELDNELTEMMASYVHTNDSDDTILESIAGTYTDWAQPHGRHFAAAQLWLLLNLVGDLSTDEQHNLKKQLESKLKHSLGLRHNRFDHVKEELEKFIIDGYMKEHRLARMAPEDENSRSIWQKVKEWASGSGTERPALDLSKGLGQLRSGLQMYLENHHTRGHHQGVYTARVVEYILQARQTRLAAARDPIAMDVRRTGEGATTKLQRDFRLPGEDDLVKMIEDDLNQLPTNLRKPLRTDAVLPPRATGVEHVSVEFKDQSIPPHLGEPMTRDSDHDS
ncbi:hypothetical protein RSOLAG22IIIB_05040 [Rhizoctonia solani]|uniref:DUF6535 domain-containing protein n=1 Tax=Rhizoctonia solani TaxID=456999 RepID=A0A0K6G2P4_9AGAM|nr:hypothetical protein RSOLAG22IIIB_05040 [Rhizoctonia solani]